jgi:hypothetical protein
MLKPLGEVMEDWIIQARFTTSDRGWAIAMGSLEGAVEGAMGF